MINNIGIVGSGIVGQTLANGFMKHGYEVMIGTTRPASSRRTGRRRPARRHRVGTFEEAATFRTRSSSSPTKGTAAEAAREGRRRRELDGQDRDRHDEPDRRRAAGQRRAPLLHDAERVADGALQAPRAAGALRQGVHGVGNALMVNPNFDGAKPTMFICGNDAGAKARGARRSSTQFGCEWRTSAPSRARARSSRCASCGASPGSSATAGFMHSSC